MDRHVFEIKNAKNYKKKKNQKTSENIAKEQEKEMINNFTTKIKSNKHYTKMAKNSQQITIKTQFSH